MIYITIEEFAQLSGYSTRHTRRLVSKGQIKSETEINNKGKTRYKVPLNELTPKQQIEYYKSKDLDLPDELLPKRRQKGNREEKPKAKFKKYEQLSESEREQVNEWKRIINDWESFRATADCGKTKANKMFVEHAKLKYPDVRISVDILYRKKKAMDSGDLDSLIDNRGKAKKGYSKTPNEIVCLFNHLFLNLNMKVSKCYEVMQMQFEESGRYELLEQMPSVDKFYRLSKSIPKAVIMLSRGEKLYDDNCNPAIDRIYDDLASNDVWVADGHKIDVITVSEDGKKAHHRLTLSAIVDLRSGVYVGWTVTQYPSSQATLLALRKAIVNTRTVPNYFYCDNGREYLTYDIGGMGHRKRKKVTLKMPPTILERLGISLLNALPANGKAKHIERDFKDFTFLSSLFDTYCGSSITTRPERLKANLKAGKAPKDSELIQKVDKIIEGYFNHQPYNGAVAADRGKAKIDVYSGHIERLRMPADETVLNLMMMRSTRMQTVAKNGVYVVQQGERLYYKNDKLHWLQGQKVYVRYDPEDLMSVRVYDEEDKFIDAVPLNTTMMQSVLSQIEDNNDLSEAMKLKRRYYKVTKRRLQIVEDVAKQEHGDIDVLKLYEKRAEKNIKRTTWSKKAPVTEILFGNSEDRLPKAVGSSEPVVIDINRMIRNAEKRKDEFK
ncbi:MAG: transposase [Clostridia bacterium]|nr:transposase [Clostridia bacterium]